MFSNNFFIFILLFFTCVNVNATLNVLSDTSTASATLKFTPNNTIPEEAVIEKGPENTTDIHQTLLSKINDSSWSIQEFEELYGNKSSYGLVYWFSSWLVDEASKQIGLNEIRKCFNLKLQQPYTANDAIKEESENERTNVSQKLEKTLKHFQKTVHRHNYNTRIYSDFFWPEEIEVAGKFLDKKLPEIRQLYKLNCREMMEKHKNDEMFFNETVIDQMYRKFKKTSKNILLDAAIEALGRSYWKMIFKGD